MLSPAQSPGPTSIFTLRLGERAWGGGVFGQQHSIHASAEGDLQKNRTTPDGGNVTPLELALKLVQVLYSRTRTIGYPD